MTISIQADAGGTFGALSVGVNEAFRFGSDNSGQLAGFRNILINGKLAINQRGVTIAAAANGAYGPDRWKKVDASNMTQIVEGGNFIPNTEYTLSGTNVTTQQITSPASGNWTLPNISITATNIQLEQGSIATPFEQRPIGLELSLCQRYYEVGSARIDAYSPAGNGIGYRVQFKQTKRVVPTLTYSVGSAINITVYDARLPTIDGLYWYATANAAGSSTWDGTWNASAEL